MGNIKQTFQKLKEKGFLNILKSVLSSKYLPFFTAVVFIISYYAAWDLFAAYYIALVSVLMLLFCDDLTPLISQFLFMTVIVSEKNSPSKFLTDTPSDFYTRPYVLVQLFLIIAVIVGFMMYRLVKCIKKGNFKLTPVFFGLAAFAGILVLNGIFFSGYDAMNLVFGACLAALFFGIYVIFKDNIVWNGETMKRIALGFVAFGALLCVELAVIYFSNENLIFHGIVDREVIGLGWGMYNTIGAYLLLCAPFPFYLATKYKRGYLFYLLAFIFLCATVLTFSRQAWGGAAIVYSLCVLALLIYEKGVNKVIVIYITASAGVIALIFAFAFWDEFIAIVAHLFEGIFNGERFTGNGRMNLWKMAIEDFKTAPVFGVGFFGGDVKHIAPDFDGLRFVPEMYHNTFMQLLSSCGIVGLLAYLVHRAQTVISLLKNITYERVILVICGIGLLSINLVDNHLFYLFPTLIYSLLIALFVKSETDGEKGFNLIQKLRRKKEE